MRFNRKFPRGGLNPICLAHLPAFPGEGGLVSPGTEVLNDVVGKNNIKGLTFPRQACPVALHELLIACQKERFVRGQGLEIYDGCLRSYRYSVPQPRQATYVEDARLV